MADQGKSLKLVAGVAQLGNWKNYKLVLYRLYYEDCEGHRKSMLIPSRLGFLAVAAGLAYTLNADRIILSLITPLTLATVADSSKSLSGTKRLLDDQEEFCRRVIEGISKTAKSPKGVDRVEGGFTPTLIIKGLKCNEHARRKECQGNECKGLPQIHRYNCILTYEVLSEGGSTSGGKEAEAGGSGRSEHDVELTLYLVVVPLNITVRFPDGSLVLLREENPERLNMESVLRASILEGLVHSLVRDIEDEVEKETSNLANLSIVLFYDTTHGSNTIIPPLAHAVNSLDNVVALRIVSTLLKNLEARGDITPPTVSFRTYFYNSDPVSVSIGKLNEREFYEMTSKGGGISYYYRKLVDAALPLGSSHIREGKELRRKVGGLIERVTSLRGLIDELVASIPISMSELSDEEEKAVKLILIAYLARLGLFHWAIALIKDSNLTHEYMPIVKFEESRESKAGLLKILYKNYRKWKLDPYTLVAGLEICGSLMSYLLTLYEAFSSVSNAQGGDHHEDHKACLTLETLRVLFEGVERKAERGGGDGGSGAGTTEQYPPHLLALSALYEGIVEPGARIVLLNEITKLMKNPERVLSYFVPRFLELRMRYDVSEVQLLEEIGGKDVICLYPVTKLQPAPYAVRNFIAHGGLTRLSKDWCIAVTKEDDKEGSETGGAEAKYLTHAICIDRPLPYDVLLRIVKTETT